MADTRYVVWAQWRQRTAATVLAFVGPEEKARTTVEFFLSACKTEGLSDGGLSQPVKCAAPDEPKHEYLLMVAMYEHATGCKADLHGGVWIATPPKPSQSAGAAAGASTGAPQAQSPEQEAVERLTARIRELTMPKAPALKEGELLELAAVPYQWQVDTAQALNAFPKADDKARAGPALADAVWRVL